jgi:D-3-phosphoglycerate dehydrogenase
LRSAPRVHVGPGPDEAIAEAVRDAGGELVAAEQAEAIVWLGEPDELRTLLHPEIRWVQLESAGIEDFLSRGVIDEERIWTTASQAYARLVAEHALALMLAGRRHLHTYVRARSWDRGARDTLDGTTIAIVGAGGIGSALIELLAPWRVRVLAVTRSGRTVAGADVSLPSERIAEVWPVADVVVLAVPATAATAHLIGETELRAMREDAWLVNVARGGLIDTDALVRALAEGWIAGAALDVTDPEPLPTGHPLWSEPRALVTPHIASPPQAAADALARHVGEQVRRFAAGEPLHDRVDPGSGY